MTLSTIVAWSVTCNGAHTGNFFTHRANAEEMQKALDKAHPNNRREVVPLTEWRAPRAAVRLTDEEVLNLRSRYGWAKETIREIEAAVLKANGLEVPQ